MRVAAVIPAYNEAATIVAVVERTLAEVGTVIVVDDGSEDETAAHLAGRDVQLIRNETNVGKSESLARGFAEALGQSMDAVVTLDADGQHRPEDIPRLLEAAARWPGDMVIAARRERRERMPRSRRFGNWQADFWISWAAGYPIFDTQCGYRLYPAALLERLRVGEGQRRRFVFESEVLIEAARIGCYAREIPIETIYGRALRASHYRATADTLRIVLMVAGKLVRRGLYPMGLLRSLGLARHAGFVRSGALPKSRNDELN